MVKATCDVISTTNSIASTYYQAVSSRVCIIPTCYDTPWARYSIISTRGDSIISGRSNGILVATKQYIFYRGEHTLLNFIIPTIGNRILHA